MVRLQEFRVGRVRLLVQGELKVVVVPLVHLEQDTIRPSRTALTIEYTSSNLNIYLFLIVNFDISLFLRTFFCIPN